jgi:integrase
LSIRSDPGEAEGVKAAALQEADRLNVHKNARLTPIGRERMVMMVVRGQTTPVLGSENPLTQKGLRLKSTKTEKGRSVALPAFAIAELRVRKKEQAEELLKLGVRHTGETLICARADGEPHQPRSLTHEFSRMMGRMKHLPRVRFHDLRHSHATHLLAAGMHLKIAQERLGHSTIVTTLDLYSHVSEPMQKEAAEKIDAALGNG